MKRISLIFALVMLLGIAGIAYADQNPDAVSVTGAVSTPTDWTVARVKSDLAADVTTINYASHGKMDTSLAVPLVSLLKASGADTGFKMDPKADPKTKLHQLRLVVYVQARDGYAVAFSLAEILPDVGKRQVWVALDEDGQPLPDSEGPMRLIVPGDAKPARWIHAVQTIAVIDCSAATTQPSGG
jgi:DMSO/TMAO reductase YedYZ molybdopterin-dependent catalytic subunit